MKGQTLEEIIDAVGGLDAMRKLLDFFPDTDDLVRQEVCSRLGRAGIVRDKAGIFVQLVIDQGTTKT